MRLKKLLREPLLHFLGLAALLFVANALLSGDQRELIIVDLATQEYLLQQQQNLRLSPLSEQEKIDIIEGFLQIYRRNIYFLPRLASLSSSN